MADIVPLIKEAVNSESVVSMIPRGRSMLPCICETDVVKLEKAPPILKKYDIVLYFRRKTGVYVMHRLVKNPKKGYIFCGDNAGYPEKGVTQDDVIAVVRSVERNGREFLCGAKYRFYCRTLFLRRFFIRTKSRLGRIGGKR